MNTSILAEIDMFNLADIPRAVPPTMLQWYSIMKNTLAFPGSLASLSKCVKIYQISSTYTKNYVSTCVKLYKIIFKYDTIFDFGVKFDIWGFVYFSRYFGLERLSQKRIL